MNKKLTLSLDASAIEEAKEFARSQGISLSKLVEGYFVMLSRKRNKKYDISPEIQDLIGVAELDESVNYDDLKIQYLKEKYLK
jgi:hypothetical protein